MAEADHTPTATTIDAATPAGAMPTVSGAIGRFVVLGGLGAGGMGVVVAAWDPALDRKVALKLLRATASDQQLEREAQAMARLQHPNVATVYEIGSAGGQRFVAMELVDGSTLRKWLIPPRPWRQIVAMFVAAGRGLQAAHAAGLVHRDFKPDNVLVGKDGRPRVSDFGLASVSRTEPAGENGSSGTTYAFGGTPAYMAPEQARGESPDALSDQFSFCVALWEALYGERPFPGEARPEERRAPERFPRGRDVPAWLGAIVARGLSPLPADRWPSMGALLEALARDPAATRRRVLGTAALLALVPLAALAARHARNEEARSCSDATARLAGVWDAPRKEALARAFAQSGVRDAAQLWEHTRALVDDYAGRWAGAQQDACRATRIDGRQSESLLDLRTACLDRRRATLKALGDVWLAGLTPKMVTGAPVAAAALPPLDECSDPRALTDPLPLPRDPQARARIADVRGELDRVKALLATSSWGDAEKAAVAAQARADATAYAPLQAEARMLVASAMLPDGNPAVVKLATEASRQAALAHDDRMAAGALIVLTSALASNAARFDEAVGTARSADAFVARAGDPADLRGRLAHARGEALLDGGKPAEAQAALGEALSLLRASLGENAPDTLRAAALYGGATDELGDHATARATFAQLVAIARRSDGPDGPREGAWLNCLGMVEEHSGHFKAAREHYRKSLAIYLLRLGPDAEAVGELQANLGNVALALGELDEAERLYLQARALLAKIDGEDHPYLAVLDSNLGAVRREQGRLDEATELGERSVALAEKAYGREHPQYANFEGELAHTLEARGRTAEARQHLAHALAVLRASNGDGATLTLSASEELAELDAAHGKCASARPTLESIAAQQEKRLGQGHDLAKTLRALARCDVADGHAEAAAAKLSRVTQIFADNGSPSELSRAQAELLRARASDQRRGRGMR